MVQSRIVYSIVVPVYNEEGNIKILYERIIKNLKPLNEPFEIIFINDGSTDNSLKVLRSIKDVKIINLSRNFGQQAAIMAGLRSSIGKAIITLDCDLQDPPEIIPEMIKKWKEGFKIVYGKRKTRKESFIKKVTAKIYYLLLEKSSKTNIPRDIGEFRLIDQQVLNEIKKIKGRTEYLRGLISWLGLKSTVIEFDRPNRTIGKTKYTTKKMFKLATDGLLDFSIIPLKLSLYLGTFSILLGIIFSMYMLIDSILNGLTLYPLYKWLSVGFLMMFGFLFLLIWILGEYIGRIYEEIKGKPEYIVRDD